LDETVYNNNIIEGKEMKSMVVSKEELLHIAKLANLNIHEDEIDKYIGNLEEILNFANVVNSANVDGVQETIAATELSNVFRKDEVVDFEDKDALLKNAPEQEDNMFKIPKVIN